MLTWRGEGRGGEGRGGEGGGGTDVNCNDSFSVITGYFLGIF